MEIIKESVTPSGVPFSVRNLIGDDQDLLTKQASSDAAAAFNQMLCNALRSLGTKKQGAITPNVVKRLLSNDRKFILVTIRQHTLDYKKTFEFKYEWPMLSSQHDKDVVDYEVNLTPENFPVVPFKWMREKIKEEQVSNSEFKPDGHIVCFPVLYQDYDEMLNSRTEITGKLPKCGYEYKWRLLDGEQEMLYAPVIKNDMRINLMLEMRKPQYLFLKNGKEGGVWTTIETGKAHVMDLEHLRSEIKEIEGTIDTSLTIQHPQDRTRQQRVDLITLPVFFFPSQAV